MIILSLLPLLLIILIFIGIVVINNRTSKKPFTFQKSKWLFIGYVGILIIGAVFSPLLPTSEAKQPEADFLEEDLDTWPNNLYMNALEGGFAAIDQDQVNEQWEYPYPNDSLFIEAMNYDGGALIEKTSELQDEIEIFFVKGFEVMKINSTAIDISEFTPNVAAELESSVLLLKGPDEEPQINLAYTEPEFTIKQFIDSNEHYHGYSYTGAHFFFIRVPEELNVSYSDYLYVETVDN